MMENGWKILRKKSENRAEIRERGGEDLVILRLMITLLSEWVESLWIELSMVTSSGVGIFTKKESEKMLSDKENEEMVENSQLLWCSFVTCMESALH